MNQVVPMGYAKTRMGTSLAVVIATGTGLLTWLFVKNGAAFSDVKYFCMVAAALILVCVFSDVTKNRKCRTRISHMQFMLSCPSVVGEVREIKRISYFFGRELRENPKVYAKGRNVVYRIVAVFHSPVTGQEEVVVSEPYSCNIAAAVQNHTVAVHYSKDGQYWIEL